jgi:hypothetical protein
VTMSPQLRALRRWIWQPVVGLREFIHRGRHGWAPRDTWGLDHYLARVMAESIHHLADHSAGWPGFEGQTYEDWTTELHKHAAVLAVYGDDLDWELDPRPTLHRLADVWWHLWD